MKKRQKRMKKSIPEKNEFQIDENRNRKQKRIEMR